MTRRALVVVLDEGLSSSRVSGIFHNVRLLPGVYCVADLASIDRETLDRVLLTLAPEPETPTQTQATEHGGVTPYYEQDGITIYHGDCREVMPPLIVHGSGTTLRAAKDLGRHVEVSPVP